MGNNILLHRISHCWQVSWPLLNAGYLSTGWQCLAEDEKEKIDDLLKNTTDFDQVTNLKFAGCRNRCSLQRFSKLKKGDWVVVPGYKMFSIYEVEESPISVQKLVLPDSFKDSFGKIIKKSEAGFLAYEDSKIIDIGFLVKVKPIKADISRSQYADSALTSRLKVRQTNVWINDLRKSVESSLSNAEKKTPINIHNEIINNSVETVLNSVKKITDPDKLEKLVKWYFSKIGASKVEIPAKHNSEKDGYEDADVIATFELLKLVVYVQVKKHYGTTEDWGVKQIKEYKEKHTDKIDDYSVCAWVLSTANEFNENAIRLADENDIRLINGEDFATMLLEAGFAGLEI